MAKKQQSINKSSEQITSSQTAHYRRPAVPIIRC